jgi:hypothetical protein
MARLLKREGSYLLIAKVLVISRLLHKALSQSKSKPPIVDQLWERLLSVRRKLLRRIDKRLASTTGESATLVESMSAYALATSSTPTDVLQHFHKVRMDAMVRELRRSDDELAKHGISALKLCIQTCLDTQTVFPRRLAEALAKLKTHPLIQDSDIRGLYELNLDVHDRWIGDEARNFTPQPRHDELQRPEAERILHRWSKDAVVAFLRGVKKALEGEDRLKEVASLRQELIETWILSGSRMAGVKSTNVLDDLRDMMNEKLESIVQTRTQKLQDVVVELITRLDSFSTTGDVMSSSLWNATARSSDLSNGARGFKDTIVNTYQGRDQASIRVTSAFDNWMDSVLEVKGIVKSMKEARWDDTFADDVDDESDDELGDSKQTLLSSDDPRLLEEATQEALGGALKSLGKSFSAAVDRSGNANESSQVQRAAFILRAMREIGDRIPRLKLQDKSTSLPSPFSTDTLQLLHTTLATHVSRPTIESFADSLTRSTKSRTNSQILWEGNPPLPSQPSPGTFRFLRELNKSMASLGSDLWGPGSVAVLKGLMADEVGKRLDQHMEAIKSITSTHNDAEEDEKNQTNGDEKAIVNGGDESDEVDEVSPSTDEAQQRKVKQTVFDALYIQRFIGDDAHDHGIARLVGKADIDDAAMNRLRKNATDYAKKTYLLFALLA